MLTPLSRYTAQMLSALLAVTGAITHHDSAYTVLTADGHPAFSFRIEAITAFGELVRVSSRPDRRELSSLSPEVLLLRHGAAFYPIHLAFGRPPIRYESAGLSPDRTLLNIHDLAQQRDVALFAEHWLHLLKCSLPDSPTYQITTAARSNVA